MAPSALSAPVVPSAPLDKRASLAKLAPPAHKAPTALLESWANKAKAAKRVQQDHSESPVKMAKTPDPLDPLVKLESKAPMA